MTEHGGSFGAEYKERACCAYSGFRVGAALLCGDGSVYTGCSLENASYPCGLCEQVAAAKRSAKDGGISACWRWPGLQRTMHTLSQAMPAVSV